MRITVDNGDGRGAVEYTAAVAAEGPVTVRRELNAPSRCTAELVVGVGGLAVPVRRGRVVVTSDAGAVLFTGYLATEPVRVLAGAGCAGPVYRVRLNAVSDEWLLDKAGSGAGPGAGSALGMSGGALVQQLVQRAGGGLAVVGSAAQTGLVVVRPGVAWSENAAAAAGAAYAGYRAVSGQVLVQPAGATVHALSDGDGTLDVAALETAAVRDLANDVTLSGEEEPAAYVVEEFAGDGTTTVFPLSEPAFRDAQRMVVRDSFAGAAIDRTQWAVADPGSHLALTAAGLTMSGGNGQDGATTLTAIDGLELGGTVVVELSGVKLGAACDGMLGGCYGGTPVLANCFAGFRVRQSVSESSSATVVVPVVNGVEVGTSFAAAAGQAYTLRMRLHCAEMQRVMQRYFCMVDGAVESFGSPGGVDAAMDLVFEVLAEGASSNTPAAVLYDSAAVSGPVPGTPASCFFVAVNAAQMFGSVAAVSVVRDGSLWVVSTMPGGAVQTRLTGVAGTGVDCAVSYGTSAGTPGKVTFFAGRVPVAGERVEVRYRTRTRAVARMADAASVAAEATGSVSGVSRFVGRVLSPKARSSADCESASQAVLAFATSRSAAVAGTYAAVNPAADVWPGDVLSVTSDGATTALLVRSVEVEDGHSAPETLAYRVRFANDWATELADGLGVKLSDVVAADAVLPSAAVGSGSAAVLPSLNALHVTAVSATEITVDAGLEAPAGGGFEVRRRDGGFGASNDGADLVLRSPVRHFTIPRASAGERYFVRMYDGSAPALYSRFSSAVFANVAVS